MGLPRPHFRPDVEGLRAVAVGLVVAFHAGVPGFGGGYVGVDVFFVVSGYLITWLLVDEGRRAGRVDLWRFYARRARRLVPALAVVLVATAALTAVLYAPMEQRDVARLWPLAAFYLSNVGFADWSPDYHGLGASQHPLLHTWSLGVEEQFYLAWPGLVALGLWLRRRRGGTGRGDGVLAVVAATTAVSFALSTALTYADAGQAWAFYLSPPRAWEFGVGALAVLVPARGPAAALGWGGLAGIAVASVAFGPETAFPGLAAVLPVLATAAVLWAGARDAAAPPVRLLSARPLQAVGRLSYSWYLWHWPALVFADAAFGPLPVAVRVLVALGSLGPAALSYRYVEAPLRYAPWLVGRPGRSLVVTAGASVAVAALAGAWWSASGRWAASPGQAEFTEARSAFPAIYADGCDRYGEAALVPCAYGEGDRLAVLLGDSHAGQFFPAVRAATDAAGWRLVVMTLSGCPFADLPALYNEDLDGLYNACPAWRSAARDAVAALRPEAVFVASSNGYGVADDAWAAATASALGGLAGRAGRVVLIADPPPARVDVPACLGRAAWRPGTWADPDCRPRGFSAGDARRAARQVEAARGVAGVAVLDVSERVCPGGACGPRDGGRLRYRDGGHLTRDFAATLAPAFAPFLADTRAERSPAP